MILYWQEPSKPLSATVVHLSTQFLLYIQRQLTKCLRYSNSYDCLLRDGKGLSLMLFRKFVVIKNLYYSVSPWIITLHMSSSVITANYSRVSATGNGLTFGVDQPLHIGLPMLQHPPMISHCLGFLHFLQAVYSWQIMSLGSFSYLLSYNIILEFIFIISVSDSCISFNILGKPQNEELLLATVTYNQKTVDKSNLKLPFETK